MTAETWPELADFDPWTGPEPAAGVAFFPITPAAGADLRTLPPRGRTRPSGPPNTGRPGWCYLFHLDTPIGPHRPRVAQAQHYLGWAGEGRLFARLRDDYTGRGARLLAVALDQGISVEVIRLWRGDRHRERSLKQSSATRYCPVCNPGRAYRETRAERAMLTRVTRRLAESWGP